MKLRFSTNDTASAINAVSRAGIIERKKRIAVDLHSGYYSLANVPDHLLPLAFGADPASAGSVTKVPKAWKLGASARWAYFFVIRI